MKWKNVENVPKGINIKVDIGKLKGFRGICYVRLALTDNIVYFEEMKIEFPFEQDFRYDNCLAIPPMQELTEGYYP